MDSNYLWSCSFDLYVSRDFLFRNETVTRVIFSKDSSRIPTGYTRWLRNFFGAFYWIFKNSSRKVRPVYSSVPNRHACTFINFEKKIHPAWSYFGLHVYWFWEKIPPCTFIPSCTFIDIGNLLEKSWLYMGNFWGKTSIFCKFKPLYS